MSKVSPKFKRGMWAGRKKNLRGGIGLGAKKYFERGNRAGRKKLFERGEYIREEIFLITIF